MHITKYIGFSILLLALLACKTEVENDETTTVVKQGQSNEFQGVEELFNTKEFEDTSVVSLLKEINICSDAQVDKSGKLITPCTADNFKFFSLNDNKSLKDGFILLVKANVGGVPLRRVLVFERENGALIKVNGFIANVIGKRKSAGTNDDLLLRFIDKIEGSDVYYNCILKWENNQYVFKTVEVIEEPAGNFRGIVKENVKDSVSKEIHQTLVNNNMIF
jgi:hypothetical protein